MSNYLRDERLRHKSKRQEKLENIVGGTAIIGGFALAGTAIGLEASGAWKVPSDKPHNPPVERHGDHHGSAGMPSQEHLQKFTAEHGINLNQK